MIRKFVLAAVAIAAVSTAAIAPAEARMRGGRGPGPGLAIGAVAGVLALGAAAAAASQPTYYDQGYGPGYYPAPRAYYYGGSTNCDAYYNTTRLRPELLRRARLLLRQLRSRAR